MRRDYFTLDVENVDWVETDDEPAKPSVTIDFDGPANTLRKRLMNVEDELLEAQSVDIGYRLQGTVDDPETTGVVSISNSITGEFVLELNEEAGDVLRFVKAARRYGQEGTQDDAGRYEVEVLIDEKPFVHYDKRTFLVYDEDGNLLRQHSLIPSGVEL
ncbi:MAG: hypothetical protein ACI9PP_001575 [Halobacteriales archaeon]|jgi:hypothetical protein